MLKLLTMKKNTSKKLTLGKIKIAELIPLNQTQQKRPPVTVLLCSGLFCAYP